MKTLSLALAGLVAVAGLSTVADAQTRTVTTHTVVHTHRGPMHGRTRRVCTVRHRYGRTVRTCRTVRY